MKLCTIVFVLLACGCNAQVDDSPKGDGARPDLKEWKEGQAEIKEGEAADMAKQDKMAAVDKVVEMLESLQAKVLEEGEAEAATYNKFACWCKTTQKEKTEDIKTGQSDKESLSADIAKFSKQRDALDKSIAGHIKAIKHSEKQQEKATVESDAARKVYETDNADLKAALYALTEAIKVLKASKTPTLVQMQSIGATIKQAAMMADALGLGGAAVQKAATFFLQQGSGDVPVEMEDYKFHSGGIIETLEDLLGDFRKTKADQDADEVQRVKEYDMFIQKETDFVKAENLAMDEAKAERLQKIQDIETASQELTTTSATLLDDMEYLDELNTICSNKAKTWDQRTRLRSNELTAITQAAGIIKATVSEKTTARTARLAQTGSVIHLAESVTSSDSAMQAIEAEAEISEGSATGFLQLRSVQKHSPDLDGGRQLIISLLNGKGKELKSTLLMSLATQIGTGGPFTKIKKLIQELIERLLQEAANESNQKGWCDKATADAKQKRTYAAGKIEDLNVEMAKLAALSDKLGEEIKKLAEEIAELNAAQAEASKNRKEEKTENESTVREAAAGLEAVSMAIDILTKFYATAAKAEVDLSLAQGPLDDAPDAGFDNGEAYKGQGAESGGIIGMMEVIQSDFERTISETHKAEKDAEQAHLEFMTESGMSLAEKNVAEKEKTKLKDETDQNFNDAQDEMAAQTQILVTSIKELIELKAACIDTGMSYADRVAMREQEIASLKKALCILGAYAQYGPDGLADAC